jgi:hypothetical protein
MTAYFVQGQNYRFLPCQFGDSIQQPFGYRSNVLITRLPAAPKEALCRGTDLAKGTKTFLQH